MTFNGTFKAFNNLAEPFGIGLAPIATSGHDNENKSFLHIDEERNRYLNEKKQLYQEQFNDVFKQEENTLDAQLEVKELISNALGEKIPDGELPPLAQAALHVQDDLLLMRRNEQSWRLVAGSLCFPSSWNLNEKFGRPLEEIHAPVPYIAGKMGDRIRRIFDSMKPEDPLWRQNWSLKNDEVLRHDTKEGTEEKFDFAKPAYIRWEYQTLHKLSVSGDILFTVKILVRPFEEVIKNSGGKEIIEALKSHYEKMGEDGRKYKRIESQEFLPWLEQMVRKN